MTDYTERWHRAEYEEVRKWVKSLDRSWDELTEEERVRIRAANVEKLKFMNDLGKAIQTGGPLPDPF